MISPSGSGSSSLRTWSCQDIRLFFSLTGRETFGATLVAPLGVAEASDAGVSSSVDLRLEDRRQDGGRDKAGTRTDAIGDGPV